MEVLVLDGKEYTKASKAARDLGYTADYVGQLCRSEQVNAHLIGRTWYVDKEELASHRHEKKRISRVKAREQAKKSIAEHRVEKQKEQKNYRNIAISYETDESELIPETRIVEVETEISQKPKPNKTTRRSKKYEVENEGEKMIMQGSLSVIDASDDAADPHTTILEPTIMTSEEAERERVSTDAKNDDIKKRAPRASEVAEAKPRRDFKAKLEDLQILEEPEVDSTEAAYEGLEDTLVDPVSKAGSWFLPVVTVLCLVALAVATLPISRTTTYTAESVVPVMGAFEYDVDKTIQLIKDKL